MFPERSDKFKRFLSFQLLHGITLCKSLGRGGGEGGRRGGEGGGGGGRCIMRDVEMKNVVKHVA